MEYIRAVNFIKRYKMLDIIGYAALMGVGGIWLLTGAMADQGYYWQWYQVPKYLIGSHEGQWSAGPLLDGLRMTLAIAAVSLVFTNIIGLTTALMRLSESLIARSVARIYLEFTRNTPLLVQIFFVYFVLAPVLGIDRFAAGVTALSLFEGAYASEIYRSGIVSIDRGQWEAAHALGLRRYDTYRYIVLPQAVRRVLPPLTGQSVSLIKDSSLLSVIAIYELTMKANDIVAETFLVFEIYFTIAAIYLILALVLSQVVAFFERRYKVIA
jgi:polar amino acid transport system permease protein